MCRNIKEHTDKIINSYIERIECPECKRNNDATVEVGLLFNTYAHNCINCNYVITESEWNTLPNSKMFAVIGVAFAYHIKAQNKLTVLDILFNIGISEDEAIIEELEPFIF